MRFLILSPFMNLALQTARSFLLKDGIREQNSGKGEDKKRKGDERVISDVSYLEEKGLLQKHFDVADIGCGPGRFVAAFARRVHRAVGLDISEKMIAHGMEYLKEEQLTNASLHTCDFQSLDLDKEGYRKAFDLVFSSMTPALRGMDNLKKSMEMSRGWCCHVTHLSGRNYLREQILWELFGKNR